MKQGTKKNQNSEIYRIDQTDEDCSDNNYTLFVQVMHIKPQNKKLSNPRIHKKRAEKFLKVVQ